MSTFLDIVMSTILFGILALTVARVQTNINSSMCQNQFSVVVQTNAVELARQLEWDFAKIGHHVTGQKVLWADSTSIRFLADLTNTSTVDDVRYFLGDTSQLPATTNPIDVPMFRRVGLYAVKQNWGLTQFRITYYDAAYNKIPTPITTPEKLQRIHAINIGFRIESPEPVYSEHDTTWAAVTWEKMIIPRNLNNLNY
ncbi:MAG: hypothetical protein FJ217_04460 [Ignavibacteria bacterium]|nr:hypothetical protein [Ignavibacteria bacterium]